MESHLVLTVSESVCSQSTAATHVKKQVDTLERVL